MVVLPIIAALTLAQANPVVTEPLRPDMSSAPPRAERTDSTAQTNDDEAGFGGSGEEGTTDEQSAAEKENAQLRAQLEKMNDELTKSREAAELSAQRLEELQQTTVNIDASRRRDEQAKAQREAARVSALQTARDGLAELRKDALYDTGAYERVLVTARFQVSRAAELNNDAASTAAMNEIALAEDAFSDNDLDRMIHHANAAITLINRAAIEP
jgi:hypothetical protein